MGTLFLNTMQLLIRTLSMVWDCHCTVSLFLSILGIFTAPYIVKILCVIIAIVKGT